MSHTHSHPHDASRSTLGRQSTYWQAMEVAVREC